MKIITHNGQFHADEVVAFTILNYIFDECTLERSRDQKLIDDSDIVIDIGKIYDPENNRFDHHQENCNELFYEKSNIPMSSVGMVYKKYGKSYLNKLLSIESSYDSIDDNLYYEVYENLIKEIDAIDNGIKNNFYNFNINTGISRMISRFNCNDVFNEEIQKEQFYKASNYSKNVFEIIVMELYSKIKIFNEEYEKMTNIIDSTKNNYIIVNFDCINWYKCINQYYIDNKNKNKIDWIIYRDDENWRIRTIFRDSKKLKDENFIRSKIKNVDDLIFVHKANFLAGAKTKKSIKEIAKLSS